MSYLFGLITIVLFTSQFAPLLLRIDLRAEAEKMWRTLGGDGALGDGQRAAAPALVGRAFRIDGAHGATVFAIEQQHGFNLTIEQVRRNGSDLPCRAATRARVRRPRAGRRPARSDRRGGAGSRRRSRRRGLRRVLAETRDVVLTRRDAHGLTVAQLRERAAPEQGRGVYIAAVTRLDSTIPALPGTELNRGDVLTLVGAKADVERGARRLGYVLVAAQKTDFVYLGLGVLAGMAIGHLGGRIGGVSLALGTGGGCLLSGLLFGWIRSRYPLVGSLPSAAAQILEDFGLAHVYRRGRFVGGTGCDQARARVRPRVAGGGHSARARAGAAVAYGSAACSSSWMRRCCSARSPVGSAARPRSARWSAWRGNSTPVIGYTITYALSNILLPLMGPSWSALPAQLG